MVINTNVQALQTANNLNTSSNALAKSLSRLSSGSKIIAPSDDAAGLAVSSRLESQLKRLDAAINNVVNAVSFTQTQDGFLKTIDKAFRRMSELAMFAQDSTKSASDLTLYSQEFTQLQDYVSQSVKQTFNSVKLFSATPLAVTIDSTGTTFDMAPIDLGQSEYVSSLSLAAPFSATTTQLTRNLTNKTITMDVSEEEYKKVAVGGSFTLGNLTTGASKAALNTAKANLVTKRGELDARTAEKTTAYKNVADSSLAKAYFDAIDTEAQKLALKTAADAAAPSIDSQVSANTLANAYFVAKAAEAGKSTSTTPTLADTQALTATALTNANANADSKALVLAKNYYDAKAAEAGKSTSTTPTLAATEALTATALSNANADTKAAALIVKQTSKTDAQAVYDLAVTATSNALTATTGGSAGSNKAIAAAAITAKGTADSNFAAATVAVSTAEDGVSSAQSAYDRASLTDISGLNGTYDITGLSKGSGVYQVTLDISGAPKALAFAGDITNFGIHANPNSSTAVNLKSGLDITSVPRAQASLTRIRNSIDKLAQDRASLGAVQSRLNFTNEQLTVTKENLSAAISRIADVDVAEEATSYARYQILVQSGTSMLAQANKMPQSALQLLQG